MDICQDSCFYQRPRAQSYSIHSNWHSLPFASSATSMWGLSFSHTAIPSQFLVSPLLSFSLSIPRSHYFHSPLTFLSLILGLSLFSFLFFLFAPFPSRSILSLFLHSSFSLSLSCPLPLYRPRCNCCFSALPLAPSLSARLPVFRPALFFLTNFLEWT